jgi:hypothetical protein
MYRAGLSSAVSKTVDQVLGKRLEERLGNAELSPGDTETPWLYTSRPDRPNFGYRNIAPAEEDDLSRLEAREIARKVSLGLVDIKLQHDSILD